MAENQPDWTIDQLYKGAWEIVKKQKILWLFGIAATGASFSFNFNGSSGGDSKFLQNIFQNTDTETKQQSALHIAKVLGAATSPMSEALGQFFSYTPWYFYIFLAIELVFLLGVSIILAVIYRAWTEAALLESVATSIKNETLSIRDSSEKALGNIKSFAWLQIVPGFLLILLTLVPVVILIVMIVLVPGLLKLLILLFALPLVLVGVFAWISLTLITTWASRIVITQHKPAGQAFKEGFTIARKKFWASLLLGTVNNLFSGVIFGIPLFILIGIFLAAVVSAAFNAVIGVVFISLAVLLMIVFFILAGLGGGIYHAFKTTVWSLAYNNIKGKYVTE